MNYFRAARRFWWVVLVGIAFACLTGLALVYKVDKVVPPHLAARSKTKFTATTQLLVDSPSDPYLRVATEATAPAPTKNRTTKSKKVPTPAAPATPPLTTETNVDTKTLIDAANLFPLFVESDSVLAVRRQLVGDIPGVVAAKALYASLGLNRFRPSQVPVVQISAVAPRPKFAIALAEGTANAFEIWLKRKQDGAKIPRAQRIVLRELHTARDATAIGGPSYSLPALAGLAVLGLFIALAVLLDQQLPPARVRRAHRPLPATEGPHGEGAAAGLSASGTTPDTLA